MPYVPYQTMNAIGGARKSYYENLENPSESRDIRSEDIPLTYVLLLDCNNYNYQQLPFNNAIFDL